MHSLRLQVYAPSIATLDDDRENAPDRPNTESDPEEEQTEEDSFEEE